MLLADLGEQKQLCKHHLETCCKISSHSLRFPLPLRVSATWVYGEEASMEDLGDVLVMVGLKKQAGICAAGEHNPIPFHKT